MCGFVAVRTADQQAVDRELLGRMRDSMTHRGPDDAGIYTNIGIGLAHRRLSIIDLSAAGHQPMSIDDGRLWIVFNGEIFNYVELREELKSLGHQFDSDSDTEVILRLYKQHGDACVLHLNGMFGFLIWDAGRKRLFGARDRFGIKPFYYYEDPQKFICASELKAILTDSTVPRVPDHQAIADYGFCGGPLAGKTFFKGLNELPPGYSIVNDQSGTRISRYWDLEFDYQGGRDQATIEHELRELFDDAVRIHCRSDAPLGAHLSGGIDSSTVSAFAARHVTDLNGFSIRFDWPDNSGYDETAYAQAVASAASIRHHTELLEGSELSRVYLTLLWHMDHPASGGLDSGFSYFAAARLAHRHVKVALTGHGGDELFAGYPAQFVTAFGSDQMFARPKSAASLAGSESAGLRMKRRVTQLMRPVSRKVRALGFGPQPDWKNVWIQQHCFPEAAENPIFSGKFVATLGGYQSGVDYLRPFEEVNTDNILDQCLYHDLRVYLPQLLHKEDRASMAVSIESRVPMLDPRIASYLAGLNNDEKVPGREPKALLRRLARGVVPEQILKRRDKIPFAMPMGKWIGASLKSLLEDTLRSERFLDRGIFNADRVKAGAATNRERLTMANLELWYRIFIDQDPNYVGLTREPLERGLSAEAASARQK